MAMIEPFTEAGAWDGTPEEKELSVTRAIDLYGVLMTEATMWDVGDIKWSALFDLGGRWLPCDGSEYTAEEYPALFDALGNNFGGDVLSGLFNVPDLRYRSPVGVGSLDGAGFPLALGQKIGVKEVTLTTDQIPAHNHTIANGWLFGVNGGRNSSTGTSANHNTTLTTNSVGGGQAHNNLSPGLGLQAFIYAGTGT